MTTQTGTGAVPPVYSPPSVAPLAKPDQDPVVPVSVDRLDELLVSSSYWTIALPIYADRLQRRADGWAIASGVLAVVTSLAVWTTMLDSAEVWAQAIATAVAILAGVFALIPRVRNYGEMAGKAREIQSKIAHHYGTMVDLWIDRKRMLSVPSTKKELEDYEEVRSQKDDLRYLPRRKDKPLRNEHGVPTWNIGAVQDDVRLGLRMMTWWPFTKKVANK